jgi:hypothetical protein
VNQGRLRVLDLAVQQLEWCHAGGSVPRGVVSKFEHAEPFLPSLGLTLDENA